MKKIAAVGFISCICLTVYLSGALLPPKPLALAAVQADQGTKTTARKTANRQNAELESLYQAHQWFRLRDAVQATKASAFYQGLVDSAFNDVRRAEKNLRTVIKYAPRSPEAADARAILIYLYLRNGRYGPAFSEAEKALSAKPEDAGLKNAHALLRSLRQYPEQSVAERRSSRIHYSMKDGNLFIPVEVNRKSANYIVDTGANFSLISEGEAKRLGLTVHESGGSTVGDSAGASLDVRIAVADQLTIGRIRFTHVSFLVMRDDQQPFKDLPAGERGVLGLPVLNALQTLRWNREGAFEIGFAGSKKNAKSNICFEGSNLIIEGQFRQSRINVFLDTGATRTRVLPLFAKEFPAFINESGRKGSDRVTGVGSSVEADVITLPALSFRIGGFDAVLQPAQILLKDTTSDTRWSHVWAGLDLLNQARVVTLDFKSMTLALE